MTSSPSHDAEYTRKVALGILSTLQHKGLISSAEVDAILRAAMPKPPAPSAPLEVTPASPPPKSDPTRVRREPLPPPVFDIEL
ncbi:hypothetical protein FNU79_08050 [Deinococcus detaillensis]|uniref:Uncharacterized protein n=1 Tax=Deinococcus detaillensis TaxID=2592048 RepID=A0A553V0Y2_9DEIO|nr:hypothetical protein [Deinococcus detaillensis]TSA86127.1 hypothetical protein FNU79_08050 [Deinococcus detaillensis]